MRKLLIIGLLYGFCIAGCGTLKQDQKHLAQIQGRNPQLFAGACAEKFPVTAKEGKTDTVYRQANNPDLTDSLSGLRQSYFDLYQQYENALLAASGDTSCQNIIKGLQDKLETYRKKIEKLQKDYKPCVPDTIRLEKVDTVPDLAAIAVRDGQISSLSVDRDNWQAKAKHRSNNEIWLIVALVISVGWNFRKLIFKMFV